MDGCCPLVALAKPRTATMSSRPAILLAVVFMEEGNFDAHEILLLISERVFQINES